MITALPACCPLMAPSAEAGRGLTISVDAARWELEAPACANIRRRVSLSKSFGSNPIIDHLFTAAHRYRAIASPPLGI